MSTKRGFAITGIVMCAILLLIVIVGMISCGVAGVFNILGSTFNIQDKRETLINLYGTVFWGWLVSVLVIIGLPCTIYTSVSICKKLSHVDKEEKTDSGYTPVDMT